MQFNSPFLPPSCFQFSPYVGPLLWVLGPCSMQLLYLTMQGKACLHSMHFISMTEKIPRSYCVNDDLHQNDGSSLEQTVTDFDYHHSLSSPVLMRCCCLNEDLYHKDGSSLDQTIIDVNYDGLGIPVLMREWENQVNMTRVLQLQFSKNISKKVSAGKPIKGEDGLPLKVTLIDRQSGELVTFGHEASARMEIVGLNADCGVSLGDIWTRKEFISKIIRNGKNKQFLFGDVCFKLEGGIGHVGNFQFVNGKYKNTCAYKLGVLAVDDDIGSEIIEGLTDSFVVQDYRNNYTKKHHPPTQLSEVYRLVGIQYKGSFHQSLCNQGVNTVEDFLLKLNTDPKRLRNILGSMTNTAWNALVKHAQECKIDERLHLYSSSRSRQKFGVLFNVVGQVIGLYTESQYVTFEKLSEMEKARAMSLVAFAYQQPNEVVTFNNKASLMEYLTSALSFNPEKESEKLVDKFHFAHSSDFNSTDLPHMLRVHTNSFADQSNIGDITNTTTPWVVVPFPHEQPIIPPLLNVELSWTDQYQMYDQRIYPNQGLSDFWIAQFPKVLRPGVERVLNVEPDGNCGYRAVSLGLNAGQEAWGQVRKDMLINLLQNKPQYIDLNKQWEETQFRLDYFDENCTAAYNKWMAMPEMGYIIASTYNVVFVLFGEHGSWTFLPLQRSPPPEINPHNNLHEGPPILCLGLVKSRPDNYLPNHFILLSLHHNAILPPAIPCEGYPKYHEWLQRLETRLLPWGSM